MIKVLNNLFVLESEKSTYCFRVTETKHLQHLYYGPKIEINSEMESEFLYEKHAFSEGNSLNYDQDHLNFTLETMKLECSTLGKGDIREPLVKVINTDGSFTSDFLFESYRIQSKEKLTDLPFSKGEKDELVVTLKDTENQLLLELFYSVYEEENIIVRHNRLINQSEGTVNIERLLSNQVDFDQQFTVTSFHGNWANEMNKHQTELSCGKFVLSSSTGTSSSRTNPFFMLSEKNCTEDSGLCYGFNLLYSGNHYSCIESDEYGHTHVVSGIHPEFFSWELKKNESFETPEAVMTVSDQGFNELSHGFHDFINRYIVPEPFSYKVRKVLINSWEACYFKITESKLLKLAKKAKDAGVELFVCDDGWFKNRNSDSKALGDWTADSKKLPSGVKGLCEKINALDMDFGLWVEPEMVNVDSDLYRLHPEWVLQIPDKNHSEGRNQRILDLSNPEVVDYLTDSLSTLFSSCNLSYVKWDMNRIFSDIYSPLRKNQKETLHRYYLGLYRLLTKIREQFPDLLIEGCASGGNRFDLGMLCYCPQIWASDNTDAYCRSQMQYNYSYGYPQSVISAHVSGCPNHQTLRNTPLETRYNIASFGILGYELDFNDLSSEECSKVRKQIELYKQYRDAYQFGTFYRIQNEDTVQWNVVKEQTALAMIMNKLAIGNKQQDILKLRGLKKDGVYHFVSRPVKVNIKDYGSLINTASPVHIRQNSLVHNIASKVVDIGCETDEYTAFGNSLMNGGVHLHPRFAATGMSNETRHFPDFASRLYILEEKK